MTPALVESVSAARRQAEDLDREYIGTQHLLLAMLERESTTASEVMRRLGIDVVALKTAAEEMEPPPPAPWGTTRGRSGVRPEKTEIPFTTKAQDAYRQAIASASDFGDVVGTGQLLFALLDAQGPAGALMSHFGMKADSVHRVLHELYELNKESFRTDEWVST